MKFTYLGILLLSISNIPSVAQKYDSIPFSNVRMQAGQYELDGWDVGSFQLKTGRTYPFLELKPQGKENFEEGVWTLLTGLNTSTLRESAWIFPNSIEFQQSKSKTKIPLIVKGYYEKTRERVKQADGSKTLETTENIMLFLDEGAWGWFIHQNDTVGEFAVTKRGVNQAGVKWNQYFGSNLAWLQEKLKKYGPLETPTDFYIEGRYRGENFKILYSGQYYRAVLIKNDKVQSIWQDTPYAVMLVKKHKINPYVLMPQEASKEEAQEMLRMLGLAHLLSRNLMGI